MNLGPLCFAEAVGAQSAQAPSKAPGATCSSTKTSTRASSRRCQPRAGGFSHIRHLAPEIWDPGGVFWDLCWGPGKLKDSQDVLQVVSGHSAVPTAHACNVPSQHPRVQY